MDPQQIEELPPPVLEESNLETTSDSDNNISGSSRESSRKNTMTDFSDLEEEKRLEKQRLVEKNLKYEQDKLRQKKERDDQIEWEQKQYEDKISRAQQAKLRMEERKRKVAFQYSTQTLTFGDWRKAQTEKGETYYYNIRTKETTWKLPSGTSSLSLNPRKISGGADMLRNALQQELAKEGLPHSPRSNELSGSLSEIATMPVPLMEESSPLVPARTSPMDSPRSDSLENTLPEQIEPDEDIYGENVSLSFRRKASLSPLMSRRPSLSKMNRPSTSNLSNGSIGSDSLDNSSSPPKLFTSNPNVLNTPQQETPPIPPARPAAFRKSAAVDESGLLKPMLKQGLSSVPLKTNSPQLKPTPNFPLKVGSGPNSPTTSPNVPLKMALKQKPVGPNSPNSPLLKMPLKGKPIKPMGKPVPIPPQHQ